MGCCCCCCFRRGVRGEKACTEHWGPLFRAGGKGDVGFQAIYMYLDSQWVHWPSGIFCCCLLAPPLLLLLWRCARKHHCFTSTIVNSSSSVAAACPIPRELGKYAELVGRSSRRWCCFDTCTASLLQITNRRSIFVASILTYCQIFYSQWIPKAEQTILIWRWACRCGLMGSSGLRRRQVQGPAVSFRISVGWRWSFEW